MAVQSGNSRPRGPTQEAKIECARKFFASLTEKNGQDVIYDVVTDYTELMQLVTA